VLRFPDIRRWFHIIDYTEINNCRKIEVNMKSLSKAEVDAFSKEFALYVCRLRCPTEKFLKKMENAINHAATLSKEDKEMLQDIFYTGFISDKKYKATGDYKASYDDDAVKGYFGECFYYILREQIFEDEKIYIEPKLPKCSSKVSGIDFVDIRRDKAGYYMIIGEVKTTENSYSSRLPEIIETFRGRIQKNFSEMYQAILENDDESIPEYTKFLEEMLEMFYRITGKGTERKRVSGTIHYDYHGNSIGNNAFYKVKKDLEDVVDDAPTCRRFKLIGIYNVGDVVRQMRDIIWNVL
jgi:hypothetical protein